MVDVCVYCDREYPGMTVWVKKKLKMWVCHDRACQQKARNAGYRKLR